MPVTCSVDIGRATYEAQAHRGVGGPGTGACSGDLLLGALAACAQLTCQMVATSMGIPFRSIEVSVDGDLDLRGTLGVDKSVGAGFEAIRLRFDVDAPEATRSSSSRCTRRRSATARCCRPCVSPPTIETEIVGRMR